MPNKTYTTAAQSLNTAIPSAGMSVHVPIPGRVSEMEPSHEGGFVFTLDPFGRLTRFLILGSDSATYYEKAESLTLKNVVSVQECLRLDGPRTVSTIVQISESGRAARNDAALFALALCIIQGNRAIQDLAVEAAPRVARIGTHLFTLLGYLRSNKYPRKSKVEPALIRQWYLRDINKVAYQMAKYRQRDGWTTRDVLRLGHVRPDTPQRGLLFNWAVKGWESVGETPHDDPVLRQIWAVERLVALDHLVVTNSLSLESATKEVVKLIVDYTMTHEMIPGRFHQLPQVWECQLGHMPMGAMIRNLANMTRSGLLTQTSDATRTVVDRLGDSERLRKARIHPINVLMALRTYEAGRSAKSDRTWTPVGRIVTALDDAFYRAFAAVEPTNQNFLLAVDVSSSMAHGTVCGIPGFTPAQASGALALVTAATEPNHEIVGFCGDLVDLPITPRMRLAEACRLVQNSSFGSTDCSLPMRWALTKKDRYDAFMVLTDSETGSAGGSKHPSLCLAEYRKKNVPAKLIVVGMVANNISIADPTDPGMLDVVGFDANVPALISDFVRGFSSPVSDAPSMEKGE